MRFDWSEFLECFDECIGPFWLSRDLEIDATGVCCCSESIDSPFGPSG